MEGGGLVSLEHTRPFRTRCALLICLKESQIFEDTVAIQDLTVSQSDVYSVEYAAGGIAPVFENR